MSGARYMAIERAATIAVLMGEDADHPLGEDFDLAMTDAVRHDTENNTQLVWDDLARLIKTLSDRTRLELVRTLLRFGVVDEDQASDLLEAP